MAPAPPKPPSHPHLAPAELAAPGRALLPGTVLAEFEFGHVLAESRFAIVYQATDHSMDRQVAIKEYLPTSLATRSEGVKVQLRTLSHAHAFERGRRSFIEEAKQLGRSDHPALLRVHRLLHANGTVYRVMPYCPGISLAKLRQQMHAPPDEAQLRNLLAALLGALDTLHRQGLVHGEVAPANIVLQPPDDQPLLMDFGAVRRSIVGDPTRSWMSLLGSSGDVLEHEADSEHAHGRHEWPADGPAGPWNDVSALAAVLYFWITGHWPEYPPSEPLSRVVMRLHEYLPQLDYSAALLGAIDAALAPRLQDRPQSVAQFNQWLAQADSAAAALGRSGTPVPAQPPVGGPAMPATPAAPDLATAQVAPGTMTTAAVASTPLAALAPSPELPGEHEAASAALPATAPDATSSASSTAAAATVSSPALRLPRRPVAVPRRRWVWFSVTALGLLALALGGWQIKRQLQANTAQNVMANAARGNPPPAPPADLPTEPTRAGVPLRLNAAPVSGNPREACSGFPASALRNCMKTLCAEPAWSAHRQCKRLRDTDRID